jgi:hypothetical protein
MRTIYTIKQKNPGIIITDQKFITMTKSNQIIHVRCNICEIMIIEEDIEKHISTQEHQMRKKALEHNLTNLKGEDDGYPSIVSKWMEE